MPADTLSERLGDWNADLSVDHDARLVSNVALAGVESRNGYRYSESALRDAIRLYDQKPVFLDHAADRSRPKDRSTRDLVGTIVAPRFEDGRIRGDIRVLDTESGRTFLALTSSDAPGVGMSHVVLARRSPDGELVESIEDVVSVDAVVNPATTTTFRESTEQSPPQPGDGIAGSDQLVEETTSTDDTSTLELTTLRTELNQLRKHLVRLQQEREQEHHARRMDALLAEAGLPEFALTPAFRRQLDNATDDHTRQTLLHERLQLIHLAARHPPTSTNRTSAPTPNSTAAFLTAIKRR